MKLLAPPQVAEILHISPNQARLLMNRLPHVDVGMHGQRYIRIDAAVLDAFIRGDIRMDAPTRTHISTKQTRKGRLIEYR